MQEKIEEIAEKIKIHRQKEIEMNATNNAFGRVHAIYGGKEMNLWLTNSENVVGAFARDINNNITGRLVGPETTLKRGGEEKTVYKNTRVGEILICYHEGTHSIITPSGLLNLSIFNRATYIPIGRNGEFANDIIIRISGDSKRYSYKNLAKILEIQNEIDEANDELNRKRATIEEEKQLLERIALKEKEKRTYLSKTQGFIRKYAQLRYQPILDPIQESIKRSKVYEGTLIINGGPGTGKTTSLIQRIKFLISKSISEYIELTSSQKEILFSQKTIWIFFSPNELLALFLRNSMTSEELIANDESVKVWSVHKNKLIKEYRFVSTESQSPFFIFNNAEGKNLFSNNSEDIIEIITRFENYFLNFQKDKLFKLLKIEINKFNWNILGQTIKKYISDKKNIKNFEDLIFLYLNLSNSFKADTVKIAKQYSELINIVTSRIQVQINKNPIQLETIKNTFETWRLDNQDIDDNDDETVLEQEDFEEKEDDSSFDFEKELFLKLKALCRKKAFMLYDKSINLTKKEGELLMLIPELVEQEEYDLIGQTAYFKKYFERLIKGIEINIFREIPMIYKKFRREQLNFKSKEWNIPLLEVLVKNSKKSRIHPDEQSLLINFVNNIILKLYKISKENYDNINHTYLEAFKQNCKPVIGIDEATDFSIIDLLAISSFRHPEISSVTLSGDIMQRMTKEGINKWEDFTQINRLSEIKNLEISYRQSPTLLKLAEVLHEKITGNKTTYKSFIDKDELEPSPLMLISIDEEIKLRWISNRIIEIHRAYGGSIPSIAIFLPEENQLEEFAYKLSIIDELSDVGILVKACRNGEVLGDKNTVRVFSVKVIKGLEFESVFFHNIDDLENQGLEHDLLLRYLYVGLSRATFYLSLTLKNDLSKDLAFLTKYFTLI